MRGFIRALPIVGLYLDYFGEAPQCPCISERLHLGLHDAKEEEAGSLYHTPLWGFIRGLCWDNGK